MPKPTSSPEEFVVPQPLRANHRIVCARVRVPIRPRERPILPDRRSPAYGTMVLVGPAIVTI
jgi:hypothetical protein